MDNLINLIQEVYADCTTCQEVAEVYATIKMENQKQMESIMQYRVESEKEEAQED
nr:hypothetical protein [uncultured Aminipila sp.]